MRDRKGSKGEEDQRRTKEKIHREEGKENKTDRRASKKEALIPSLPFLPSPSIQEEEASRSWEEASPSIPSEIGDKKEEEETASKVGQTVLVAVIRRVTSCQREGIGCRIVREKGRRVKRWRMMGFRNSEGEEERQTTKTMTLTMEGEGQSKRACWDSCWRMS